MLRMISSTRCNSSGHVMSLRNGSCSRTAQIELHLLIPSSFERQKWPLVLMRKRDQFIRAVLCDQYIGEE